MTLMVKLTTVNTAHYGGRSTTHELVDILHHWHQAIDNNSCIRAVFIDYAKAFDHVDHSIVIRKLTALGVAPILVRWVCSFLIDRQQRVKFMCLIG